MTTDQNCQFCPAMAHDARTLESHIEGKVSQWARRQGWLTFKWQSVNNRGVPDRLFFKAGLTVIVEFKRPGGVPTELQERRIRDLKGELIPTFVCDNAEAGKHILETSLRTWMNRT